MSYILDALKKLERKRPQEETRPTLTLGEATKPAARPRVPWLTLVAVGLILNAMVLVWWMVFRGPYHPPRSAPPPPRRALVKPAPSAVPSPATSIARDADRRMTDREQTLTPVGPKGLEDRKASAAPPEKLPVSDPVKTARPDDKRPSLPTAPKSPAEQPRSGPPQERLPATVPVITPPPEKKSSAPDRAKEPPPPAAKKEAPRNDRVFNLNELPADVRSALPPLKVSAHVYSPEPQSRLVRVNEQLLQEGQDSTEGLKVVEIMPKGIVFRFQGYRFRMELP